uniref:Uncharacterized protein n=1 Tax=Apteryx owenii TaxID=8824 RepID=A0A8B9PRV1_APTOW
MEVSSWEEDGLGLSPWIAVRCPFGLSHPPLAQPSQNSIGMKLLGWKADKRSRQQAGESCQRMVGLWRESLGVAWVASQGPNFALPSSGALVDGASSLRQFCFQACTQASCTKSMLCR